MIVAKIVRDGEVKAVLDGFMGAMGVGYMVSKYCPSHETQEDYIAAPEFGSLREALRYYSHECLGFPKGEFKMPATPQWILDLDEQKDHSDE